MSAGELLTLAAAAAGVCLLVALSWLMGFRAGARVDEASLAALLGETEPGAAIVETILDASGRAGAARLADGRWFIVRAVGDKLAVRVFSESGVVVQSGAGATVLRFADIGYPPLRLRG